VSTGLNLAIRRSVGEIVTRIDGHAVVAPDFVRQGVALLAERPEAWCVGGPIRHSGRTAFGRAAAIAMSHPLGVGNASHRYAGFEGYTDGAQFPAYRRWVFDRIGEFDEALVRNQDDELSYRIRRAGGRIYVSPRVRYTYFVRDRAVHLFKQYFQYGFWRIPMMRKHRRPTTVRQLAPALFYATVVLLALVGIWMRQPIVAVILPLTYVTGLVLAGIASLPRAGLRVAACVPVAMATMHAGYGWGLSYGLAAHLLGGHAWTAHGRMASLSR
jgi:GT2 family glycosyltransferase